MATTDDVVHPMKGLKHGPYPSQWDLDTEIYGVDWRSRSGHTDGWWWATDGATLCGVQDGEEFDEDEADRSTMAEKVVRYLTEDLPAPLWAVEPRDLGIIGGVGHLRDWGLFDLDRVSDAAAWVYGDDMHRLVVAVTPYPNLKLHIVSPTGRVAQVMGMRLVDEWYPTIDLPVTDAVAEAIENGSRERHAEPSTNGSDREVDQ